MASITLAEAQAALDAALKKARDAGVNVGIAVVDDHGDLIACALMDNVAFAFLPDIARGKALATVLWRGAPSGTLVERAGSPVMAWVREHYGGRPVYAQGAVAIKRGDRVIGAIGAGGASSQQDEDIAAAGAAAVR